MKLFWIIVAAAAVVTAFFFVLREDYDKAFIAAALGAVAWFLNYRVQLRATLRKLDEDVDNEEPS